MGENGKAKKVARHIALQAWELISVPQPAKKGIFNFLRLDPV